LERQIALQQYFTRHQYYCRMTPDIPLACACLSTKSADCMVLFVDDVEILEDAAAFRQLCRQSPLQAPATVMVISKRLVEQVDWEPEPTHRILLLPVSSRELREEIALAMSRNNPTTTRWRTHAEHPASV
jgi:hypothetical protein